MLILESADLHVLVVQQ